MGITWESWRGEEVDGYINIISNHVFIEFMLGFHFTYYDYDGLPLRAFGCGFFNFGYGKTHEWIEISDK